MAHHAGPLEVQVWHNRRSYAEIWTPLQVAGDATVEKLEMLGGVTPLRRLGQPTELASMYLQLVASDASYAMGQVFGAAGGSGQPYPTRSNMAILLMGRVGTTASIAAASYSISCFLAIVLCGTSPVLPSRPPTLSVHRLN